MVENQLSKAFVPSTNIMQRWLSSTNKESNEQCVIAVGSSDGRVNRRSLEFAVVSSQSPVSLDLSGFECFVVFPFPHDARPDGGTVSDLCGDRLIH